MSEKGSGDTCCCGLKVVAMPEHLAAGFHALCRVPDTNFSRISAALLFDLRARASTLESVAAFHALCARGGLDMRTAQLFDNAVGHRSNGKVCKDYGDLVLIDKPLATALHMAAERIHSAFGGLYAGKLDCIGYHSLYPVYLAVGKLYENCDV